MILLSGQRPSEVLSMRRGHLHAKTWRIPAAITKSKRRVHVVPVTQAMQKIIDGRPDGDLLFPDSSGDKPLAHARLSRALQEARANEDGPLHGIAAFSPHDLRRTAATHLGALGYLDAEIGILLNHSSAGVTKLYNRGDASSHRLRPMLEAWHRRLDRILTGATADVVRLR
jgi:integrase